jgi:hypothetical protein
MRQVKGEIPMALYELRTYTLHIGKIGKGGEARSGDRLPSAPERRAGQKARRVFPERDRHDQLTGTPLEIQ